MYIAHLMKWDATRAKEASKISDFPALLVVDDLPDGSAATYKQIEFAELFSYIDSMMKHADPADTLLITLEVTGTNDPHTVIYIMHHER